MSDLHPWMVTRWDSTAISSHCQDLRFVLAGNRGAGDFLSPASRSAELIDTTTSLNAHGDNRWHRLLAGQIVGRGHLGGSI